MATTDVISAGEYLRLVLDVLSSPAAAGQQDPEVHQGAFKALFSLSNCHAFITFQ